MRHARVIAAGQYQDVTVEGEYVVTAAGHRHRLEEVTWLPPVQAGTILALALNYGDHATELNLERPEQPALFPKFRNALVGHLGTVVRPRGVEFMHYENELAVIIGRSARRVKAADAMAYVKGYTIFNDLVVRDFVINHFRPPVKPKNFDTFGPIGPWWVDAADIEDPHNLEITTYVNGELRQRGNTRDMLFRIPEIIEYVSEFMTLEENDILCTGTPKGISHIRPGDVMELHIEGIGMLKNRVVAEETLLEEAARLEVSQ
ncbi:5-oxopent-3-ene-1,2,5-tricarboxylate decarboxylase/2-hydroxyhepta-2,4-diene-1,7-dioate isomerase [Deinobacterium chartae]|uniref:5-oxopent-3-ene-1,2,5-tricarboxylate decarboxylase/2-hydroxyhepta-2,4-diene-1,7-dioate isomerase n=1 Tax=Deinobacterium chartae TaxID=521158 RepID=A0A841I3P0_9DEIO|nr:fumarylacetoacetate hydrolase family protein [Deinobacterium chartae]MBB6099030.1 5-oxopent-3-ene-1,2,5-tricarboxylate decarboxylase/2-hydroxyhepta-2,4-diene-1,7-dioate isomerase [Deinobacterium chartae]